MWLDEVRTPAEGSSFPDYHRNPLHFLRSPGWIFTLVFVVFSGIAVYFLKVYGPTASHTHKRAEGIQWVGLPASAAATIAVLFALLLFFDNRIRFREVETDSDLREIIGWGILSGLIGVGIAILFEWGIPHLFHSTIKKEDIWQWIPGPAEELGKILLPIVLWFTGRYRLPRQGFLLVLISGVTFGIVEGTEYGASPEGYQISRPFGELMHPLLTGTAAAIAWRAAWGRKSWFTVAGVLGLLYVMFLHSANDGLLGLADRYKGLGFVTPVLFVVLYFSIKATSRQLVPPDNVERVPPKWRPLAPKQS